MTVGTRECSNRCFLVEFFAREDQPHFSLESIGVIPKIYTAKSIYSGLVMSLVGEVGRIVLRAVHFFRSLFLTVPLHSLKYNGHRLKRHYRGLGVVANVSVHNTSMYGSKLSIFGAKDDALRVSAV